jgi:lysophospholipase L1-like esterase
MKIPIIALHSLLVSVFVTQFSIGQTAVAAAVNSAAADFAQKSRYREANLALVRSGTQVRIVFLGDSLTEYWGLNSGKWFDQSGWINRGIGGQTTSQLLLRERDDALELHPLAIVLEGGSNDMRLGFSPEEIRDHLLTMAELARAHGLAVFITTMTPTCDCFRPLSGLRTVERIRRLNTLLVTMCKEHHWNVIDINSPLSDSEGLMKAELTVDGVHPNDRGYALLAPVVEKALRRYH